MNGRRWFLMAISMSCAMCWLILFSFLSLSLSACLSLTACVRTFRAKQYCVMVEWCVGVYATLTHTLTQPKLFFRLLAGQIGTEYICMYFQKVHCCHARTLCLFQKHWIVCIHIHMHVVCCMCVCVCPIPAKAKIVGTKTYARACVKWMNIYE